MTRLHQSISAWFVASITPLAILAAGEGTDPLRSLLPKQPGDAILRVDLDADGDPDTFERWWQGKRIRWIDENDNATTTDVMPDGIGDCLQVDCDGDGSHDGPSDITVKWADCNGDGIPDIELYNENPSASQKETFSGSSHFFVSIDLDKGSRFSGFSWERLKTGFTDYRGNVNWTPNYHGNSIFLKEHMPAWAIENPEYCWENPFLFWDPDGDGCAEVSMRVTDSRRFSDAGKSAVSFDGIADEVWLSWDIDNDAARDNEKDFDLTLYFAGAKGIDYRSDVHRFPGIAAPEWALRFFRHPNWRKNETFRFLPHESAVKRVSETRWGMAFFTFDEDDDCHRWERVELYYPGDPYLLDRSPKSMIRHSQADSLGDRGEWDLDFSGGGKLYLAPWDGRLHLLGAESGAWTDDPGRKHWGAAHPNKLSSTKAAVRAGHVVTYQDVDGNGFFDLLTHDFDGDKQPDLRIDFLKLGVDDRCQIIDPLPLGWDGLRREFAAMDNASWQSAMSLHRTAFQLGLADASTAALTSATSVHEKYENAPRIRLAVLRNLLKRTPEARTSEVLREYLRDNLQSVMIPATKSTLK